jgi:hypothetical protein
MKDILEPFMFPHNLMLFGLLLACMVYRKKGLWLLLAFYYLAGNSFVANQVRHWYDGHTSSYSIAANSNVVVLGCGGSQTALPACAKSRLQQLAQLLPDGGSVIMTTQYCKPYVDYLLSVANNVAVDCFYGGDNTYKEFNSLAVRQLKPDYIVTSDFHAWRVKQLTQHHGFSSQVVATSSQTFRQVNCGLNCLFTVNLTNFDFYSKLTAEFASYAVFVVTRSWTSWYQPAEPAH